MPSIVCFMELCLTTVAHGVCSTVLFHTAIIEVLVKNK